MCDNPDCVKCNGEARKQMMADGLAIGNRIVDLINEDLSERKLAPSGSDFDGYMATQLYAFALTYAASCMIANISSQAIQDNTVTQIALNLRSMVIEARGGPEREGASLH